MGQEMNLAIVGVPKSGTSMLCNALTVPGEAIILYEPGPTYSSAFTKRQAESLAYTGSDILSWAQNHSKWGVKEVTPSQICSAVTQNPEILVLMVRHIRHAALSMFETYRRIGRLGGLMELTDRKDWLVESAELMVDLYRTWPQDRLVICRYEPFVTEPAYREAFRQRIDWPSLAGDVGRGLTEWLSRGHEAARHNGAITAGSLRLREAERDPHALQFAAEVARACTPFIDLWGDGAAADESVGRQGDFDS